MGEVSKVETDEENCPDCDGQGYIVCEFCDGSGKVDSGYRQAVLDYEARMTEGYQRD